ncbi:transposable element Tcb1 transposase [Trichonephila clavipes]|nr:transposable element Tcb1 transposase [Trichonephila clavipes]
MASNGVGKVEYIESIMKKYDYLCVLKNNLKESATKLGLGLSFRLQHDNNSKHATEILKLCLLYNVPNRRHMLPQSPNLNPTEHLWDLLERWIRQHNVSNKDMLKSVLEDEWEKISAEETTRLNNSTLKRLHEVLKIRGYPTRVIK